MVAPFFQEVGMKEVRVVLITLCGIAIGAIVFMGINNTFSKRQREATPPRDIVAEALRLKAENDGIGPDIARLTEKLDVKCPLDVSNKACVSTLRILDRNPELSKTVARLRQAGIQVYIGWGCGTLGCSDQGGYLTGEGTVVLYNTSEEALKSFLLGTPTKK